MEIDLTQACVGELNTVLRGDINWPILYGVGVNIKTGEIFPATFTDKGPDQALRHARNFTGGQTVFEYLLYNTIDTNEQQWRQIIRNMNEYLTHIEH